MAFVGIDLGTTNSAVAAMRNGSPQILRDRGGHDIVPSVIHVDRHRKQTVGEAAKSLMHSDPSSAVEEIKRKMGGSERIRLGDEELLPQEIAARILRHLKAGAEDSLNELVDRAVITVPANFPDTARQATIAAGQIAGFKVERIINEPTAAALAYGQAEGIEEEVVLVYDLGGGTFDVSVVEYMGTALDVLASAGDAHLGGKDFDRLLFEYAAERFHEEHGVSVEPDTGTYFRLLHACEQAKKELSFNQATRIHLPFFTQVDGQPVTLDVEITRHCFEQLIAPHVDKTERAIRQALKDAELEMSDVHRVLLVGGSTRIPYVRQLVERVVGLKPSTDVDPDRAVALGAAIQAAIIDGETDHIIMDVAPLSFGTSVLVDVGGVPMSGHYSEIIKRNTKQLQPCTKVYHTVLENQEIVDFRVYQRNFDATSEWAEVDDEPNQEGGFNFLYRRELKVPPGPAGQEVRATYTYNLNGTVDVEIGFGNSNRTERFPVVVVQSDEEIEASRAKLEGRWQESEHFDEVRATLHAARGKLDGDLSPSDRMELEALVDALKQALAANDGNEVRRLEDLLTDLLFDLED